MVLLVFALFRLLVGSDWFLIGAGDFARPLRISALVVGSCSQGWSQKRW